MSLVPTMNIKDPEVYELAAALARRRGTSMTRAVKEALTETLDREPRPPKASVEELMEIGRRAAAEMRAAGEEFLTDDDLYDERGLPK